jgi:hypothetical protein
VLCVKGLNQSLKSAEIAKEKFWVRLWGWLIQFKACHLRLDQIVLSQVSGGDRSPLPALEKAKLFPWKQLVFVGINLFWKF